MVEGNVNERLKTLIQLLQIKDAEFARQTSISKALLSKNLTGEHALSLKSIAKIEAAYPDVEIRYLTHGDCPPFKSKSRGKESDIMKTVYTFDEVERLIIQTKAEIQALRKSIEDRYLILHSLEKMASRIKKKND